MNKWLEKQFDQYGNSHTKLVTLLTHFIGLPLVIFGLLMCLAWFKLALPPFFSTNFAWVVSVLLSAFYLYLDWRLALSLLVIFLLMSWGASILSGKTFTSATLIMAVSLFLVGWAVQVAGHYLEEKKLVLISQPYHLLIAPLFFAAEAAVLAGWRKDLRDVMQAHTEVYFN